MPTLAELRSRVNPDRGQRSSVQVLIGDVRALHADPAYEGALFQVASQFNLLEMTSEHVTPEQGVARYAYDHTQGPACAMAAGAATIYRNYCVPVGDRIGQTSDRQLDALAGLGSALSDLVDLPVSGLWRMQNGYALCTREGLTAITCLLDEAPEDLLDRLRGHWPLVCTAASRSPTCTASSAGLSRRLSARRFRSPIRLYPNTTGSCSHDWSCRPPTKQPCWSPPSRRAPAAPTQFC